MWTVTTPIGRYGQVAVSRVALVKCHVIEHAPILRHLGMVEIANILDQKLSSFIVMYNHARVSSAI